VHGVKLHPGDRLLFFTDGAIENRNEKGHPYGISRLRKCIKRLLHLPGDELLVAIVDDIAGFIKDSDLADDMTLVLMEIN
jgi:sigma-B regulation protein RsbU (phosphoserine phosphatase)